MIQTLSYQHALHWLFQQNRGGAPRDSARMRKLREQLQLMMPPVTTHIVGSNGKGTVTAMIAAAYTASGRRTGRFVSPHVEDFGERIQVDHQPIAAAHVEAFISRVKALELNPNGSFFELCFALALEHFQREQVAVAAIEAGVGAKHDATIILDNVRCVVITNVTRDHLATLGPSVRDIARDKAEAIRPGIPTVTAATGEALEIIAEVASLRRSPLFIDLPRSPLFSLPETLEVRREEDPVRWHNQRLAAAALRVIGEVDETAIQHGLEHARLPARAERFSYQGRPVLLDGAHNPSAAQALRRMLRQPFVLLFGALPKKLAEETLAELEPYALKTFLTQADHQPITLEPSPHRHVIDDPTQALHEALASCPQDAQLVITGSLYLAGQLRPLLRDYAAPPLIHHASHG